MNTYDRRTFVKQSAMLAGAAAAGRLLPSSAFAQSAPQGPCPQGGAAQPPPVHPFFKAQKGVDVIAHRGGKGQWPEETLLAFREAVRLGVDVIEMDVHGTRDNVLVLMHDKKVKRTTGGKDKISDYWFDKQTLPQGAKWLGELNAGKNWPTDCDKFPPDGCRPVECSTGERPYAKRTDIPVPRLEDVFKEFKDAADVRMIIEIKQSKPSIVVPFCALLKKYELEERVLVASFDDEVLAEVRAGCGGVATSSGKCESADLFRKLSEKKLLGLLASGTCNVIALVEHLLRRRPVAASPRPNVNSIQVWHKLITEEFVQRAHCPDVNLKVHAWTVNEEAEMRRMLKANVDGIITDCPGLLLKVLNRAPK